MSDKVTVNAFPGSRVDALTMLYLEKSFQPGNTTPEDLTAQYIEVHQKISIAFKEARTSDWILK